MVRWILHSRGLYTLLEVDPKILLSKATNTNADFKPDPLKLVALTERFMDGEVDAPIVHRDQIGIAFLNGRHKAVLAARLGLPTIKIAVLKEEVAFIQSLLGSSHCLRANKK